MVPQWIIEKKRDGAGLTEEEIRSFVAGYDAGKIPDYQMAALAMAIYFKGMTFEEIATLTDAMMRSGRVLDLSALPVPTADKHSTGGIGDKVSLVLAPLVACCNVAVPMISGRGLGITGGTLDKLESIPGYRTDLSVDEFMGVLDACGCSIIGQTPELAPVDRKLYALRDVTGTVPSIPLITASIMSKKLAEGARTLVLDVKWGSGAFMQTLAQARELASTMVGVGSRMGRSMSALLTDMNQPLGTTAGNAVEVAESVAALRGCGSSDLTGITVELGAHMVTLAGKAVSLEAARDALRGHIDSGAAFERFRDMVRLHGGTVDAIDDTGRLPRAAHREAVTAPRPGYVAEVNAMGIGRACLVLGAGRKQVTDAVDPAAGITDLAKIGDTVTEGQPLATLHANDGRLLADALELARAAFRVEDAAPEPVPLITDVVEGTGMP